MTRLTLRTVGVAMALLLTTSAVAAAVTFEGKGWDDPKVQVRFEKTGGKIKRFKIERVRFSCADGYVFRDSTRLGEMRIRRTRSGERRFSGHFRNADGDQTAEIRGTFRNARATGRLRLVAVYKDAACDTRRVDWSARRIDRG